MADDDMGSIRVGTYSPRGVVRSLAYTSGDAEFGEFFHAEYARAVRTVYLVVHDQGQAEQIAQDAFVQLLAHWSTVAGYYQPGAWVRRVAIRKAVRSSRRERTRAVLERRTRTRQIDAPTDLPVPQSEVLAAVEELPANQRVAVVLCYFEGRPVAEIADILGCASATARVHLRRARRRLASLQHEEVHDVVDSRVRAALRQSADAVDPAVDVAFRSVLAERERRGRRRQWVPIAVAAVSLVLVGALLTVWRPGSLAADDEIARVPRSEFGTYEAVLGGDLTGTWRLRLGDGILSVVAPDTGALGARLITASFRQEGAVITTDLLGDGPCTAPGDYRWTASDEGLGLRVEDDECELRSRLLSSEGWRRVGRPDLPEGSYRSETLTPDRMRQTARAAGHRAEDVEDYIAAEFAEFGSLTYTLQLDGERWVVQESVDGGPPAVAWTGPYRVVDAATVVAGEAPCGPISYDYRRAGNVLHLVVLEDACIEDGAVPVGELVAQTTRYESAPFTQLPE